MVDDWELVERAVEFLKMSHLKIPWHSFWTAQTSDSELRIIQSSTLSLFQICIAWMLHCCFLRLSRHWTRWYHESLFMEGHDLQVLSGVWQPFTLHKRPLRMWILRDVDYPSPRLGTAMQATALPNIMDKVWYRWDNVLQNAPSHGQNAAAWLLILLRHEPLDCDTWTLMTATFFYEASTQVTRERCQSDTVSQYDEIRFPNFNDNQW